MLSFLYLGMRFSISSAVAGLCFLIHTHTATIRTAKSISFAHDSAMIKHQIKKSPIVIYVLINTDSNSKSEIKGRVSKVLKWGGGFKHKVSLPHKKK